MEDIAGLISDKFVDRMGRVQCGIVYCLSKADCEKVTEQLQSAVDSLPYQQGRRIRCKIKYAYLHLVCMQPPSGACCIAQSTMLRNVAMPFIPAPEHITHQALCDETHSKPDATVVNA